MTWFLVYLHNLREPLLIVGVLGIALCAIVGLWGMKTRNRYSESTPHHAAAVERQLVSLKAALGIGLLSAFVWGIPAPDYDIRYVDRPTIVEKKVPVKVYSGVKVVEKPSTYDETFSKCISSFDSEVHVDGEEVAQCHQQALTASKPAAKVVEKRMIRYHPYKQLFDSCNDNWIGSIQDLPNGKPSFDARQQRMEFCHRAAMEASGKIIARYAKGG